MGTGRPHRSPAPARRRGLPQFRVCARPRGRSWAGQGGAGRLRSQWARAGGAGLAAAAGWARTAGMDGERLASGSSELAVGESPRGGAPIPSGSGSCSLLQADVLDLDEDEDDLEVFSKVRAGDVAMAVAGTACPGKVPG